MQHNCMTVCENMKFINFNNFHAFFHICRENGFSSSEGDKASSVVEIPSKDEVLVDSHFRNVYIVSQDYT